jgi:hypothetical protein
MAKRTVEVSDSTGQIRAFGEILAMTQWLSPEELQSYQAPLISKLLLHARKTTRFYGESLDIDLGSPESISRAWPSRSSRGRR